MRGRRWARLCIWIMFHDDSKKSFNQDQKLEFPPDDNGREDRSVAAER